MNKRDADRIVNQAKKKIYVEGTELMGVNGGGYCVSVRFPDWQEIFYSLEQWQTWVKERESTQYT